MLEMSNSVKMKDCEPISSKETNEMKDNYANKNCNNDRNQNNNYCTLIITMPVATIIKRQIYCVKRDHLNCQQRLVKNVHKNLPKTPVIDDRNDLTRQSKGVATT